MKQQFQTQKCPFKYISNNKPQNKSDNLDLRTKTIILDQQKQFIKKNYNLNKKIVGLQKLNKQSNILEPDSTRTTVIHQGLHRLSSFYKDEPPKKRIVRAIQSPYKEKRNLYSPNYMNRFISSYEKNQKDRSNQSIQQCQFFERVYSPRSMYKNFQKSYNKDQKLQLSLQQDNFVQNHSPQQGQKLKQSNIYNKKNQKLKFLEFTPKFPNQLRTVEKQVYLPINQDKSLPKIVTQLHKRKQLVFR